MWFPSTLALDYGTKKTGIAYSIEDFAFPLKTVPTHELVNLLPKIISEKKITTLVIGMPYNIDGTMSVHGKRVEKFASKLEWIISIPIVFHDERLTSSEAAMAFDEIWVSGDIDAEAARLILVWYLESKK